MFKAKEATQASGYKYAIASEGSFGQHPQMFFVPGDTEILALADLNRDIVIAELIISAETNYGHIDLTLTDTYDSFLEKSKFPSHGLIVRELATNTIIGKGITDRNILLEAIARGFNKSTQIRLETDMRAMMNPMRMKVIQELSNKLVARIQNICPACQTPGFGNISTEGKLPCKWCGSPTQLYEKVVLSCVKCDYKTYQGREDGLTQSEPTHCTFCNP